MSEDYTAEFIELLDALATLEGRWVRVEVVTMGDFGVLPVADFRGLAGKLETREIPVPLPEESYTVTALPVGEDGALFFSVGACHLDDRSEHHLYVVASPAVVNIAWGEE